MALEDILIGGAIQIAGRHIVPAIEILRGKITRFRDLRAAESQTAFVEYYKTTAARYGVTKTLLYRTAAVPLYEFYVTLDVEAQGRYYDTADVKAFLAKSRTILLTGGAGSGKSTLLRHLFLQSVATAQGIPIFVELRHLNNASVSSFKEFLYASAVENNLALDRELFDTLLDEGSFILYLDGFDEVITTKAGSLAQELTTFVSQRSKMRAIVTSRPDHYAFIGWGEFREFSIRPLSLQRTLELIRRLDYDPRVKASFAQAVEQELYATHTSFLQNPLLTTLMLMTFEQFGRIEPHMHLFYGQAYETLYHRHDATKVGYRRETYSMLDSDEFRAAFAAFSIQSYLADEVTFTETAAREYARRAGQLVPLRRTFDSGAFLQDAVKSFGLLLSDGLGLTFAHRSFQEYFAAWFILNFGGAQKRELTLRVASRLMVDNTAQLLFEMDRDAFEDNFLLDALEKLTERMGDGPFDDAWFLAFLMSNTSISVRPDSIEVVVLEELASDIAVLQFTERKFRSRQFEWCCDSELARGLFRELEILRDTLVFDYARFESDGGRSINAVFRLYDGDLRSPEVRSKLLQALRPAYEAFAHGATLHELVRANRSTRRQAVEKLLTTRA